MYSNYRIYDYLNIFASLPEQNHLNFLNPNRTWLKLSQQILKWTLLSYKVTKQLLIWILTEKLEIDCWKLIYWSTWKGDVHLREFTTDAVEVLLPWECQTKWNEKSEYLYLLQSTKVP